jgi:hypothetical protein
LDSHFDHSESCVCDNGHRLYAVGVGSWYVLRTGLDRCFDGRYWVVFKGLANEKDGDRWLAVDPQSCEPLKTLLVERLVLADQINSRLAHLAMAERQPISAHGLNPAKLAFLRI